MTGRLMNKHRASQNMSQSIKAQHKNMSLSMSQTQETKTYFQNILGPLSLFSHTDVDDVKKGDRFEELIPESSVSEITEIPASLSEFCQQLRKKTKQQSPPAFSAEDQEALASVMIAELSLIWQDLCGLPADTTLTSEENKLLRRRTFHEVFCICEQLYLHYLHLLEMLGTHSVFSHQVNRSRLASHMAMDLSTALNAHSIQRNVAMWIKSMRGAVKLQIGQQESLKIHTKVIPHALDICSHMTPKKCVSSRQQKRTIDKDLMEIQEKIGALDLEYLYEHMPCHSELMRGKEDTHCSKASVHTEAEEDQKHSQSHVSRLKRCNSMPDLRRETFLEELGMAALPTRSKSPLVLLSTHTYNNLDVNISPAEDLRKLLEDKDSADEFMLTEADIPPLIRASVSSGSSRLKELTHMLQKVEEEEKQLMKNQLKVLRPQHPQSEVENVNVSTLGIARIAAAHVSDRVMQEKINISMHPPVYNNLTGEIEPSSVMWMDQNLFCGSEIKEVYKELSKTLSDNYLDFDEEFITEPAMSSADLFHGLKLNHLKRLLNPSMRTLNLYGISHRKRMEHAADGKKPADETSPACTAELSNTNLSLDDYLKYISKQSDILSGVFHLYDSDVSGEEDEKQKMQQLQKEKIRRQQEKIDALRREKQAYQSGLWNVNTVLMGGLWKELLPDEVEGANMEIQHVGIEQDLSMPLRGPQNGKQVQARLEKIWTILCLPETQRLDMAIKYSSHAYRDKLEEATASWEQAAKLIQQREFMLSQLEQFERVASDPSRFFQNGYRGTSAARIEEANFREKLESQIAALNNVLSKTIHRISVAFNDTVTYKGRPYREKMRWDRIEMLYWLQQERRVQALEKLVERRGSLPAKLPPLSSRQTLSPRTHPIPEDHMPLASEETI
ncbi:coiled-coil domain-containing protein 87 isoform X2 [Hoplias malabaricus]|uniref:coiled-coil domain-containing protein 87 isoform X2 n=1 Tax=Hoplias malabaricus TaxID=27720 RepID=UPI0034626BE6